METIDDIVKEILKEVRESERNNPDRTTRIFLTSANMALKDFACRAKKAARHEMSDEFSAEIQKLTDELYEVKKANIRLKAALRPVLDIVMDSATSDLSMELAISEAQRIWKEGEK